MSGHETRTVGGILAGAALVMAVVGVRGDFPLSDDWSYAYSSRALCTEGVIRFLPWTGASLILQTWYGAALCRVFGFSFEVLRLSTLLWAVLGAVGFSLLLGRLGVDARARTLATALFALNPLYVNLAFTFMTDVPFTAAAVWAGYAYARGLATGRRGWLVAGGIAAGAALLIRQHGIFVAAAAALTVLVPRERAWRDRVADALAIVAVPAFVAGAWGVWIFFWHGAPGGLEHKLVEASQPTIVRLGDIAFRGLATLGFLLVPLALAARAEVARRWPRSTAASCVMFITLAVFVLVREGTGMFYLGNVLYDLGIGASTLRDTHFLGLRAPVALGTPLTVPITLFAIGAAGILTSTWLGGLLTVREPAARFVLVATALLFLGSLLHTRYYFDRYLVGVVPFAIAAVCVSAKLRVTRAVAVLSTALALYGVAGTHDYLAWNRARYAALEALMRSGVSAREIDGGMEFNAWHLAASLDRWPSDADVRVGRSLATKSWWWVVDDRFVASFRPLPGYAVHRVERYRRWLPPGEGQVFVLERATPAP